MTVPTVLRGVWPAVLLLDGDRRREALDVIELGLLHLADELPGVGAEAFDVAPLAFGVDRVHGQRALARSARAAADGQLVAGNIDVDALEIVLPRAADLDAIVGHCGDRLSCRGAGSAAPRPADLLHSSSASRCPCHENMSQHLAGV